MYTLKDKQYSCTKNYASKISFALSKNDKRVYHYVIILVFYWISVIQNCWAHSESKKNMT